MSLEPQSGTGTRVAFAVLGRPRGKGRPRADFKRGRVHEDHKSAKEERRIRDEAALAFRGRQPFKGPVRLTITAIFETPKSWPGAIREAAMAGRVYHVSKPDIDNIEKLVLDALSGKGTALAWYDDAQVAESGARKRYGSPERIEVLVEEITGAVDAPDEAIPETPAARRLAAKIAAGTAGTRKPRRRVSRPSEVLATPVIGKRIR